MSIHVMNLVWKKAPCQGNALLALLALADWSDDDGRSWPSIATLAKKSRQSERNCRAVVRWLETNKMISIKEREGNSSLFIIAIDALNEVGGQTLPPAKTSKRGGFRQKSLPPSGANTAPNTSIHTSVEEKHTSILPSQEYFQLESSEPVVEEKSKKVTKKDCDPRCTAVTAKIFEAYKFTNKVNPSWSNIVGNQLKGFLSSHPDWTEETIFECIRNRWKSDVNLAQEPMVWISKLGNFLAGPLDKYGQPKVSGSPLVMQNGTGRKPHLLDGMPGPEELAAQRLKENARIPRMPDEKFL